jgi:hypothetical protein
MHLPIAALDKLPQTRWLKSMLKKTGRAIQPSGERGTRESEVGTRNL